MKVRRLVTETGHRIFREYCTPEVLAQAEQGVWGESLWKSLSDHEFTTVSDDGMTWADALAFLQVAGYYGGPVPLAESYLASRLLSKAQLPLPEGYTAFAWQPAGDTEVESTGDGLRLTGEWAFVPWARSAGQVLLGFPLDDQWGAAVIGANSVHCTPGTNLAGEPSDRIVVADGVAESHWRLPKQAAQAVAADAALTRVMLAAGAAQRVLDMTLAYANQRHQFGRPIGKFQAVQQQIAEMAGETAAVKALANHVLDLVGQEDVYTGEVAVQAALAKVRLAQAVQTVTTNAHQVHGAMGFTQEYSLHYLTKRLWSWRHEYGNETAFAPVVMEALHSGVWKLLTGVTSYDGP